MVSVHHLSLLSPTRSVHDKTNIYKFILDVCVAYSYGTLLKVEIILNLQRILDLQDPSVKTLATMFWLGPKSFRNFNFMIGLQW